MSTATWKSPAADAVGVDRGPDALAIGCGPGEGLAALATRLPRSHVAGIDPSSAMLRVAVRRNREAVARGQVILARATADRIPWPGETFGVATAVNSMQLWEPFDASVAKLSRVLRPGGVFVAMTHEWALAKRMPPDDWLDSACRTLCEHGFGGTTAVRRRFRSGSALVLRTERSADRPGRARTPR